MEYHYILLLIFVLIAFYTDARKGIIPNILTFSFMIVGILYHLINNGVSGLIFSLFGLIVGFVVLFILYVIGAVGAGDVKLFCAIGAISGVEFLLYSCMYSIIYAGIIGIIIIIIKKEVIKRLFSTADYIFNILLIGNFKEKNNFNKNQSLRFPFMYAVMPGVLTSYYYFMVI